MEYLAWFIVLSLLAEILGTISGFGSSLLFVPVAGYFLDFHSVLGITALFHLSSNISKIALFRQGISRALVVRIGVPAVLLVVAGAWLSRYVNTWLLELVLGFFMLVLALFFMFFRNRALKPTGFNSVGAGALSGLTAGLLGTGGAVRGLALAAFNLPKEVFIATSAVIDLAIDFSRSIVYVYNGYVHTHDLYLVAILIGVGFLGTYIGKRLLEKISEQRFRQLVLLLIVGVGLATLVKALMNHQ